IEFEMVSEPVVEKTPKPKPPAPKKPAQKQDDVVEEDEPVVLASAKVTYQERLPRIDGPAEAEFTGESKGLRCTFDEEEVFVAFAKMEGILEPNKGDFPAALRKKAAGSKPPRNRITFVALLRKERCKVLFDVNGADRDEMTEEAGTLFEQIEKAWSSEGS